MSRSWWKLLSVLVSLALPIGACSSGSPSSGDSCNAGTVRMSCGSGYTGCCPAADTCEPNSGTSSSCTDAVCCVPPPNKTCGEYHSCGTCTPQVGCGWCASSSTCQNAPGSCASWTWNDCSAPSAPSSSCPTTAAVDNVAAEQVPGSQEGPGQYGYECPGGSITYGTVTGPNCGLYCTRGAVTCCLAQGHPELSCADGTYCTTSGKCTTVASCVNGG